VTLPVSTSSGQRLERPANRRTGSNGRDSGFRTGGGRPGPNLGSPLAILEFYAPKLVHRIPRFTDRAVILARKVGSRPVRAPAVDGRRSMRCGSPAALPGRGAAVTLPVSTPDGLILQSGSMSRSWRFAPVMTGVILQDLEWPGHRRRGCPRLSRETDRRRPGATVQTGRTGPPLHHGGRLLGFQPHRSSTVLRPAGAAGPHRPRDVRKPPLGGQRFEILDDRAHVRVPDRPRSRPRFGARPTSRSGRFSASGVRA